MTKPLDLRKYRAATKSLWGRVVFVDWHGVLCSQSFWHSILEDPDYPYYEQFNGLHRRIISDTDLMAEWMTGQVDDDVILSSLVDEISFDRRYRPDFIIRRFYRDCRTFRLNPEIAQAMQDISRYCPVVVATDNMHCVIEAISARPDIRSFASGIISSSDVGVLKKQSPQRFFGQWLQAHGFDFSEAILLDNSRGNCEAFRRAGGQGLLVEEISSAAEAVRKQVLTA